MDSQKHAMILTTVSENQSNQHPIHALGLLQEIIDKFVEIMDRKHEPLPYNPCKSTYNASYGGGDCEKHGRWYGICHRCRIEQDRHYKDQQHEFDYKQQRDLCDLAAKARKLISNQQT